MSGGGMVFVPHGCAGGVATRPGVGISGDELPHVVFSVVSRLGIGEYQQQGRTGYSCRREQQHPAAREQN